MDNPRTIKELDMLVIKYAEDEHNILIIDKLTNLRTLVISNCDLEFFPVSTKTPNTITTLDLSLNKIKTIPEGISLFHSLSSMDLSKNQITELPDELFDIKSLRTLDISYNLIKELPPTISKCVGLCRIRCSKNLLEKLPDEIGCLRYLNSFRLAYNQLCCLPTSFHKLRNLKLLNVSHNKFDHIPTVINKCIYLVELDMSSNRIKGKLPEYLSHLSQLKMLKLSNNLISSLSDTMDELQKLEFLDLSNNPLEKEFPRDWHKLEEYYADGCGFREFPEKLLLNTNITYLSLNANRITGLPLQKPRFRSLKYLSLSENRLMMFPGEFCRLKHVVTLELQSNKLSTLPREFIKLYPSLHQLNLTDNQFITLPIDIFCSRCALTHLCLDYNPLEVIPEQIGELKQLTNLSIAYCPKIRRLPKELSMCFNLRVLKLNNNCLNELPSSFSVLYNLMYMDISHNAFEEFPFVVCTLARLKVFLYDNYNGATKAIKKVPSSWFELSRLIDPIKEEIDVSDLSSNLEIPEQIADLKSLIHLSLQGNYLYGTPDVFHLMNLQRLNLANNRLCYIPRNLHKSRTLSEIYMKNNKIRYVPPRLRTLRTLRTLSLSNNPLKVQHRALNGDDHVISFFLTFRDDVNFEETLLESSVEHLSKSIPKESYRRLLLKLGYSQTGLERLDRLLPGEFNDKNRLQVALDIWRLASMCQDDYSIDQQRKSYGEMPPTICDLFEDELEDDQVDTNQTITNHRPMIRSMQLIINDFADWQRQLYNMILDELEQDMEKEKQHPPTSIIDRLTHVLSLIDMNKEKGELEKHIIKFRLFNT